MQQPGAEATCDSHMKELRWCCCDLSCRYGTIHSYNYMSDCEDFRSYPLGKFVSEFGKHLFRHYP